MKRKLSLPPSISTASMLDPESAKQRELAGYALRPSMNAAAILTEYSGAFGHRERAGFVSALEERVAALETGDTSQMEGMLLAQMYSLQGVFADLARRAAKTQDLKSWEALTRMAFKAQNQCRMTVETLAALRNPPVVFARQANIAQGPQQVNNGMQPSRNVRSRTRETQLRPNKLLEVKDGERMESSATSTAGRVDPQLAALGAVNRTPK
jgi:hypothetical protein